MKHHDTQELALSLLHADTQNEVVELLKKAGYWDDPTVWRFYGDREGNFSIIGNQQSRPEAALVEKLINAVDARLMSACLEEGIDPTSDSAPQSIEAAVRQFFENRDPSSSLGGTVASWPATRQLEEARKITLAVTGSRRQPCLSIADLGEGQAPADFPKTFLSIDRSNKLRIPFVQGKFNMGGTGALNFCGNHSLQLLISRRNPAIPRFESSGESSEGVDWGFTVVRRDWPKRGAGEARTSVFTYLAPVGSETNPHTGNVLGFSADELKLLPKHNEPYTRPVRWGSLLKLYEYQMRRPSHVLMKGGLLSRLELLLPEIALPIRVHECRDYRGSKERSFANSLVGLTARLSENRGGNLEPDFPVTPAFHIEGEELVAQIYAFVSDKAESYRTNEGIVFTVNGQTHGYLSRSFFTRQRVRMGRLAKSLLVVVDCSNLSQAAREKLFMNSRDRLREGQLRTAIESELEDTLGKHPALRALRERRKNLEIAERIEDSKPLEDVLKSVLRASPSLEKLFIQGQRLSRPHRRRDGGEGGDAGTDGGTSFSGKKHPTYFRFYKKPDIDILARTCQLKRRCRIKFETDVVNDYFKPPSNRGRYFVEVVEGTYEGRELDSSLTPHNGIANWSVTLPSKGLKSGDELTLQLTVTDDTLVQPFVNMVRLRVTPNRPTKNGNGERDERGGTGDGTDAGSRLPGGLELPDIRKVREEQWEEHDFDGQSACKILQEESSYTFYVNVDNIYVRTDMKHTTDDPALIEAKFIYGNVLVGLALIHNYQHQNGGDETDEPENTLEATVTKTTRALGPFLVPMIDYLGALSADEVIQETGVEDPD